MNDKAAVVLPDDVLPGVGSDGMPLRETLRRGGWAICLLAVPLVVMEQLGRDATTTLAPDIRNYFGISDATFIAIAGFSAVTLTLGGLPMAWLADRVRRRYIVVASASVGALSLVGIGLAQQTWQLFLAYTFLGVAAAYSTPVFGSLISDAYPVEGRGRIFSLHAMATPLGQAIGPALAGALAGLAGQSESAWRWAYIGLAVPYALLAIGAAVFLREPVKGQADKHSVLGEVTAPPGPAEQPVSLFRAFRRMLKVRTFLFMCLGIGVLGLALFTIPVQMSLLLGDEYGFDAFTRGAIFSLTQLPVITAMIVGGHQFDRVYRKKPERTVHVAGSAILAFGVLIVGGIWFQPIGLLLACYVLASMCVGIALVAVNPLVASVSPYRLRTQAFAFVPVFTFLMGGFFGSIAAGVISGAFGPRLAITIAVSISALVGGFLFLRGAKYLRRDISAAVDDLLKVNSVELTDVIAKEES